MRTIWHLNPPITVPVLDHDNQTSPALIKSKVRNYNEQSQSSRLRAPRSPWWDSRRSSPLSPRAVDLSPLSTIWSSPPVRCFLDAWWWLWLKSPADGSWNSAALQGASCWNEERGCNPDKNSAPIQARCACKCANVCMCAWKWGIKVSWEWIGHWKSIRQKKTAM